MLLRWVAVRVRWCLGELAAGGGSARILIVAPISPAAARAAHRRHAAGTAVTRSCLVLSRSPWTASARPADLSARSPRVDGTRNLLCTR